MAEQEPTDQGASQAAEARKTIDDLKAQLDTAKQAAVAAGQERYVERYVRGKGISDDATVDQWVATMMPSAGTITFESRDQFMGALESQFGNLIQPVAAPAETPSRDAPQPPAEGVSPQAPAQPPTDANTPSFAQPNPGAPGTPPAGQQQYAFESDHIQGLLAQGEPGIRQVEALYKQGLVRGTPIGGRFPIIER